MQLKNKYIILTGAAGFLGTHFAHRLAEEGAHLALIDLQEDSLKKLVNNLQNNFDISIDGFAKDITQEEEINSIFQDLEKKWPGVDILINNAATKTNNPSLFYKPFEEYSAETWHKVMAVNLHAAALLAKNAGKSMTNKKRKGHIVFIGSVYGSIIADPGMYTDLEINTPIVYSVSKAALVALTKLLAAHWSHQGIRVNCLSPGGIFNFQPLPLKERYEKKSPLKRLANIEEIGDALIYLLSSQATYINGHNLIVDGGFSTQAEKLI
jgi:NAD(P)-dependent dehydrogenase (short-subunit alcohol dehydrogenase family)